MEKFYINRFRTFQNCLSDFSTAKTRDYENDSFVLSGTIAKFCLTFDLSWKVMKDIIVQYYNIDNYAIGSPSENLKTAFSVGLIEDNGIWLRILNLRNRLSHDYSGDLAHESCDLIVKVYIDFFLEFEKNIEEFIKKTENE